MADEAVQRACACPVPVLSPAQRCSLSTLTVYARHQLAVRFWGPASMVWPLDGVGDNHGDTWLSETEQDHPAVWFARRQADKEAMASLGEDGVAAALQWVLDKLADTRAGGGRQLGLYYLLIKLSKRLRDAPPALVLANVRLTSDQLVGGGGFADVFQGRHRGRLVALKRLRLGSPASQLDVLAHRQGFFREALIWHQLRHPNVLPFLGIENESFVQWGALCMVSPWMQHGNTVQYIAQHPTQLRLREHLLLGAATGLQYLHTNRIIHGDLRTANVFVDDEENAVLADFGFARMRMPDESTLSVATGGSLHFMAPELHNHEHLGVPFRRTLATDRYAFGCLCYELFVLRPPFYDVHGLYTMLSRVIEGARPRRPSAAECGGVAMPDAVWELTEMYWRQDPASRPALELAIQMLGAPGALTDRDPDEMEAPLAGNVLLSLERVVRFLRRSYAAARCAISRYFDRWFLIAA